MSPVTKSALLGAVLLGAVAAAFLFYRGTTSDTPARAAAQNTAHKAPAQPVTVAEVRQKPVALRFTAIGTVQPVETVAIRARLDSQITGVHFKDGQSVKAGDLLFDLDSRQIRAQIDQAAAVLARDQAQLALARRNLARMNPRINAEATIDQARNAVTTLKASIAADRANLEALRVQLSYATIRAPISGRVGSIAYKLGSTVRASDSTALVVINRMHPIYVAFSVPQQRLPALRASMAAGRVPVRASVAGDAGAAERGHVAFLDNAIDPATGTLTVKAEFDNPSERLWPGAFVNVQVTLGRDPRALVVPEQAVQAGQNGPFVFVVGSNATAEMRPVKVSRVVDGEAVIDKGLAKGERVVIAGQQRLANGAHVEIVKAQGAQSP